MSLFDDFVRLPTGTLRMPPRDACHPLVGDFQDWIQDANFPCVGAKAALSRRQMTAIVLPDIRLQSGDDRLHAALLAFIARARHEPALFQSFAAIFETPCDLDEAGFERQLWQRVQSVSDKDVDLGHIWDQRVSSDPKSPHFSLSFAGEAFFVVGLHPQASRPARRFCKPVLVFNMHAQFEQLRAEGRYEKLRDTILHRDEVLSGSINPMIRRFGDGSEANQYSGRLVAADWSCPFSTTGASGRHYLKDDKPL